jgi:hypothetical protein
MAVSWAGGHWLLRRVFGIMRRLMRRLRGGAMCGRTTARAPHQLKAEVMAVDPDLLHDIVSVSANP